MCKDISQTLEVCSAVHFDSEKRHWHVLLEDRVTFKNGLVSVSGQILTTWSSKDPLNLLPQAGRGTHGTN